MFSYLFKYIHKQTDRAAFMIQGEGEDESFFDEIDSFWTGRYLSAGEAAWHILGFHITRKDPSVSCLPVHVESSTRHHQYFCKNNSSSFLSLLDRYFLRPLGSFCDRSGVLWNFANLTYTEYFTLFRLVKYDAVHCNQSYYFEEQIPNPGQVTNMLMHYCHRFSLLHSLDLEDVFFANCRTSSCLYVAVHSSLSRRSFLPEAYVEYLSRFII